MLQPRRGASCHVAARNRLIFEQHFFVAHTWGSCIMLQHRHTPVLGSPSAAHMKDPAMRLKSMRLCRSIVNSITALVCWVCMSGWLQLVPSTQALNTVHPLAHQWGILLSSTELRACPRDWRIA